MAQGGMESQKPFGNGRMLAWPPGYGVKRQAWLRLKANKTAVFGAAVLAILAVMAIVGPYLNHWSYSDQVLANANQAPGSEYWFGTDALGRDLFTRVWFGARISLAVGLAAGLSSVLLGTVYGSISGYVGGRLDEAMMRLVEVLYTIPFMIYAILLMLVLGEGLLSIIITLAAVCWLDTARVVRGEVMSLKEREYVLAARALGESTWGIITGELLPNLAGPIIVMATLTVPQAIFAEAFLSFLGLGVKIPLSSWGYLVNSGIKAIQSYPWQLFFPAFFISITILAFNLVGDALQDVFEC